MMALEDPKIVELYFARDEAALRHTAEKYGKRLRALSYGIVRDLQTAEVVERAVLGEKRRGGFCLFFHGWLLEIV